MRRIFFLLLAVVVFIPSSAFAQGPITIEVLEVEFWPEYDRPEMLVIYHIELSSDTQFPVTMSIRIPAVAGDPFVVAVEGVGETDYQRQVEGEWATITFVSPGPTVQLEYYDPSLTKNGDQRSFTYTWPGDFPVNSFQVIAQRPFDATSFETTPALGSEVPGANGLSYLQGAFGQLNAGQQATVKIEYQKPSDTLSIDNPGAAGIGDEVPPDTGGGLDNTWLVILLAAAGVGLIGFGVYSYTQSTASRSKAKSSRTRKRGGGVKVTVFCHNCGTQAQKGDKFCRECGEKLRV